MNNPWLNIPLTDYEGHMALQGIEQAQMLSDIFAEAIAKFQPQSIAIIGSAGGNGFERIPPTVSRVVGVDLNPHFVAETKTRFENKFENLELIVGDIQKSWISFAPVDLIFLGLVLEYVDVDLVLAKTPSLLRTKGHIVTVLQLPTNGYQQVTPSPFKSLRQVGTIMRYVEPNLVQTSLEASGYTKIDSRIVTSQGGKQFQVQEFEL